MQLEADYEEVASKARADEVKKMEKSLEVCDLTIFFLLCVTNSHVYGIGGRKCYEMSY